ncbi:hypothetical protein [Sphingobacterium prati]|uniref:hypothetical protein n=1 Tax=Sphingobacterium prati TaxID=2737006 RepID=UPI001551EDF8|nr:hypothetical protein [Sphingobacterium prati]NPE45249.1 hypothetical protein [Sphingobacterium prati]
MKVSILVKTIVFYAALACVFFGSCTKGKTNYEAERGDVIEENTEFKEVSNAVTANYTVSIEALNGVLYRGYNDIRVRIKNTQTNTPVEVSDLTFLPIRTTVIGEKSSCPNRYNFDYKSADKYFSGYTVFTSESDAVGSWALYINFTVGNQSFSLIKEVSVRQQPNKNLNMTTFTGLDDEQYVIALIAPQKPNVAENKLVAGIYKLNRALDPSAEGPADQLQFSYSQVERYTLKLDPRMPEPSMGNHSSPNNRDLLQDTDGLYHGVVNYTMTGNWTLNFILLNPVGKVIRGTEVPKDFTPGVEGRKSELHLDILF